ncbi:MAG: DMT family transporter, partial [Xanthobacteraceae bacterium]|nr:DMT family transporter [Xanthobacteraceae bacterium]
MSSFVLAAVLLGALIHASWNALVKAQPDRFVAAVIVAIGAGIAAIPVMIALPLPPREAWPYLAASAVIHVGYFALVGFAYRSADLGVAYPLTRGSAPLFTAIFAFLLIGEALGLTGWLAVIAIALGIVALSADALLRGGLTWNAGAGVMVNAGIIVIYTLIDGLGARVAGSGVIYVAWMCAGTAILTFPFILAVRGKPFLTDLHSEWWRGLLGGTLVLTSYGIALWAMTRAPIGLVAALRETSVVFAAILGAVLFGEPFGPKRWAA